MKPSLARHAAAFTLIELLMVCAIIAILASLLFPTIGMVRTSAKAMACMSNMRQIHIGIMAYASDWRSMLPYNCSYMPSSSNVFPGAMGQNWGQTVALQLDVRLGSLVEVGMPLNLEGDKLKDRKQLGIFNCPENREQTFQMGTGQDDGHGSAPGEYQTSYSGNGWGTSEQTFSQPWSARFFSASLNQLCHLDQLMAFWDGNYFQSNPWEQDGNGTRPYRGVGARGVYYRHRNRANIMYADGHMANSLLILGHESSTAVPIPASPHPMSAACWTNGKAWWGAD